MGEGGSMKASVATKGADGDATVAEGSVAPVRHEATGPGLAMQCPLSQGVCSRGAVGDAGADGAKGQCRAFIRAIGVAKACTAGSAGIACVTSNRHTVPRRT